MFNHVVSKHISLLHIVFVSNWICSIRYKSDGSKSNNPDENATKNALDIVTNYVPYNKANC